jgi:hypothetical protein
MSTFLQKYPLNALEYTFVLASFDSFFFFGFGLFGCDGVCGVAFCCGEDVCVRPLAAAPVAGADGGGIARC